MMMISARATRKVSPTTTKRSAIGLTAVDVCDMTDSYDPETLIGVGSI
jgi:hypothetical protein